MQKPVGVVAESCCIEKRQMLYLHVRYYWILGNGLCVAGSGHIYWTVWTPAEVYANLKNLGYNIDYKRIPLTREREAIPADVDAIQRRVQK